ncbi:thiamine-phosphate pyrophosphorylase [Clostridium tetanomorphum]|nr:thiamine phosphate synthase [Clostridium tetanomorphum]KAJ53467.1 thiamine-phosphate pyrophosphorylase [Clostridium tetanomorphum DSM 665]MBP1865304.1 thiamine-phosphate pyrophosphorylase [Clostridium tetanomorphum]NRS85227.1 thiamine-phosphate pyrophosphorylase [Clostridium tetanomorphum]NRZ98404.1 thiamine-phosphate pyrophosphorylase [Clostridium tetanomorphum]SQC03065.1 thiamine-phosphate pyrophosphorylase [Clostridium tetanomorphum]
MENYKKVSKNKIDYTLYLVTDRELLNNRSLEIAVEEAILGGVTLVQLREKDIDTREFYETAVKIKKITDKYNVPLIINDRADIALAIDAEGVHVGQSDMEAKIVRKLIGKEKLLGVSARTLEEAIEAERQGADYLGVGAIFGTTTKKDAKNVSLEELKNIRNKVNIPIVAIGGISENNVSELKNKGIQGIAVISAILAKQDIKKASKNIKQIFIQSSEI